MNRTGIVRAYKSFCDEYGGKNVKTAITKKYGPSGEPYDASKGKAYQNIILRGRSNSDGTSCTPTKEQCLDAFAVVTDGCDTNSILNLKRGGSIVRGCARFDLTGTGGADQYKIHFHQKGTELTWTMYNSAGKKLGGPSSLFNKGSIDGIAPQNLFIKMSNPETPELATFDLQYASAPKQHWWYTGSIERNPTKENAYNTKMYFCDNVIDQSKPGAWKKLNGGGYEREFDCYFAAWKNPDDVNNWGYQVSGYE
ncbi:hypothetical protein MMC16_001027 [Neofusicoccum parvum]|nr:hypothetical protein MMC16_001027 [Neofusicoccum parvum]